MPKDSTLVDERNVRAIALVSLESAAEGLGKSFAEERVPNVVEQQHVGVGERSVDPSEFLFQPVQERSDEIGLATEDAGIQSR